ncbi:MAG: glycine--tRNA ligase subunit beta [Clostridia bacterium]|nr:glycine--tRNA ligase subunit beta [Clostridia bacterium]
MTKDLLWEIGVEEIPARFLPGAVDQMKQLSEEALAAAGLTYNRLNVYATPRRLALLAEGMADKALDREADVKGPAKSAAFDAAGQPTKALQGFCRSQGVNPDDLSEREQNGNIYLYARKKTVGKAAAELLPGLLPPIAEKLYFPKPMRWGYNTLRFARPVRWLVALFGDTVIDIEFGGVKAGRVSRGHRLLGSDRIEISRPADYQEALRRNFVIVDQDERRQLCRSQIAQVAAEFGGVAAEDEGLLTEITYLLEYPTALSGRFEEKYLAIPPELVTTPMVDQQRYFPVYDDKGGLLPRFITVRNGDSRYLDIVAEGNEKVLRARLADAEFFYNEDLKDKMDDKVEELSAVVFHEKLGSLRQKVERIIRLSESIAECLGYSKEEIALVKRAAFLAKADLGSRAVYEFPELQGVMGAYYASAAGEDEQAAQAIREHYQPRFAGDELPQSRAGIVVALADRLDSMTGFFSLDMIPSGSQDPYALRRAASGCAQIMARHNLPLRLAGILPLAFELIAKDAAGIGREQSAERQTDLIGFVNQRVETLLSDEGMAYDTINAVAASKAAAAGDVVGLIKRARALQQARRGADFPAMLEAMGRVGNILRSASGEAGAAGEVRAELLADSAEQALWQQVQAMENQAKAALAAADYAAALAALNSLTPAINDFFTAVMVMDDNQELRRNRLALLQIIQQIAAEIGDLSKIVA